MKARLNRTFLLIAGLTILLTITFSTLIFYQLLVNEVVDNLVSSARLLESTDSFQDKDHISYHKDIANLRVTLIGEDGKVYFDSNADIGVMDNHRERPEVEQAFEKGESHSVRHSATMKKDTFYYALKLSNGCVLRVAKESDSLYSIFLGIVPEIIGIVIFILIISYIFTQFLAKSIIKPIEQMADDMDSVNVTGGYKELVPFIQKIKDQHADIMRSASMRQAFTANVSHELKTPLTAISGYAELIENGMAEKEDVTRFAGEIHRNSKRLLTLINDTIRLAELDAMEKTIEFEDVDLYEIAVNCVNMLQISAEKHQVQISLSGERCILYANKNMMEELVYNLCDNAIRYNNTGGSVQVQVRDGKEQVELSVRDTGIGIPEKSQKRVFERFYRVDKSRSKQTGGTGLGLAIVKHIIAQHNAQITLTSEVGKGTEVKVIFSKNTLQEE
ncbi:MAG: two-component sensor histidine kinase [Eubacterium sp.]|mgnify:CR=1 FL=1|nr:two-component sensor histidine kinase [Eubacterium sp.]